MLLVSLAAALAQEAPPIVNGSETSDYPQVGILLALNSRGSGYGFCSATLVKDSWVITAAHCVDAFADNERYGYGNHYFVTGRDVYGGDTDEFLQIENYWIHPDYNTRDLSNDLGLLELYRSADTTPMAVNDDSPSNSWDMITYVGWGVTGDNDREPMGIKRTVDIPIYTVSYYHIYTYASGVNVCSGDSGGAALMLDGDELELVGANSFVFNMNGGAAGCEGSGAAGASARIDIALDWLEDYAELYRVGELGGEPEEEEPEEEEPEEEEPEEEPEEGLDSGLQEDLAPSSPRLPSAELSSCASAPLSMPSAAGGWLLLLLPMLRRRSLS